jgi:hypothetical protein
MATEGLDVANPIKLTPPTSATTNYKKDKSPKGNSFDEQIIEEPQ